MFHNKLRNFFIKNKFKLASTTVSVVALGGVTYYIINRYAKTAFCENVAIQTDRIDHEFDLNECKKCIKQYKVGYFSQLKSFLNFEDKKVGFINNFSPL